MKGSVIRRMYAGFSLIVVMFIITIIIMIRGMDDIHFKFSSVTNKALPLVTFANKTSVELLSADKAFKDFLTTQNSERMEKMRSNFANSKQKFAKTFRNLTDASQSYPELRNPMEELKVMEGRYFAEAQEAMNNYQQMFTSQLQVRESTRRFQKLSQDLRVEMKSHVDDQNSIAVKLLAKSYFVKLKKADVTTSDALTSMDTAVVKKAVMQNKKAVSQLNYAYKGLAAQLPSLKNRFDQAVEQFTQDIGKSGGVLDQYYAYLTARERLYQNISNLAIEVDNAMIILDKFSSVATNQLDNSLIQADQINKESLVKAITIGVIVVLIAMGIGYHIAHSVREPMTRILKTLEHLTAGDMTDRIEIRNNNEFSSVGRHINTLADSLRDILMQINNASDNLTQEAMINQETSQGAQDQLNSQRSQTANVATAMTEMENSVREVAQSAQSSLEKVHQVETASETGRQVMSTNISTINQLENRLTESVEAVSELQKMSSEIGSILDVIQNIAEQTNLLALNAAIEAARAGEQGRGFAVVADEVRVLAQRTSESTSEIENMINSLQSSSKSAGNVIQSCMQDMELSVTQASEANSAMEEIQALILEISQMSTYISQAAAEQDKTASDIARNLEDINHIANASHQAMTEITAVSGNLTNLAEKQAELVHKFKL